MIKTSYDPSAENKNFVLPGVQHKYPETLLILTTNKCFQYCEYCFRKRNFDNTNEICNDYDKVSQYISEHHEITNVLLSGGDPLTLSFDKLKSIIDLIPNKIKIRLGTRAITYKPEVLDYNLISFLDHSNVNIIAHINTSEELNYDSRFAITRLQSHGIIIRSQTVLLRGINDNSNTLITLYRDLVNLRIFPYYIFQCRPTTGNKKFIVPVQKGLDIINEARSKLSGIEKTFRYIASIEEGKYEILSCSRGQIYGRFHQAKDPELINKFVVKQKLWE